jgi:hypothetical protein
MDVTAPLVDPNRGILNNAAYQDYSHMIAYDNRHPVKGDRSRLTDLAADRKRGDRDLPRQSSHAKSNKKAVKTNRIGSRKGSSKLEKRKTRKVEKPYSQGLVSLGKQITKKRNKAGTNFKTGNDPSAHFKGLDSRL